MKINKFLFLFSTLVLSACAGTANLASDTETLTLDQKNIAISISKIMPLKCIKGTIDTNTGKLKEETKIRLNGTAVIRRLHTSTQGWYKAETIIQGMWSNFYYNPNNKLFVCGQQEWDAYTDTKNIQFEEINQKPKKFLSSIQEPAIINSVMNDFIDSGISSCRNSDKIFSEFKLFNKGSLVNSYCSCVMNKLGTFLEVEDLEKYERKINLDVFPPLINIAQDYCVKSLGLR